MRLIVLFLFLCCSAVVYQSWKTTPAAVKKTAATPVAPTTNILFLSSDGGSNWQELNRGLPEHLPVNDVFAQNGEVFLGLNAGGVYHSISPESGLWEREELGDMFLNLGGQRSWDAVTGIFPGASGPYATVYQGGFFRKMPGTALWMPMDGTLKDKEVHTVVENPDGTLLVACPSGIYKSANQGKSWNQVFEKGWVNNLVEVDGVLLGSGICGLLRSTDRGETWNKISTEIGTVYPVHTPEGGPNAVWVAARQRLDDNTLRMRSSNDGGLSWQSMEDRTWPFENIFDLKQAGNSLFCSHQAGISRSVDGGKTWELVRKAPNDERTFYRLAVSGTTLFAAIVQSGC